MQRSTKLEIGCWASFWLLPIPIIVGTGLLKELTGTTDIVCSGAYKATCTPFEQLVNLLNFVSNGFAFMWLFFGWIWVLALAGRLLFLLIRSLARKVSEKKTK